MHLLKLLNVQRACFCVCLLAGLQQVGAAAVIQLKAQLAPVLIDGAWNKVLVRGGGVERPWPWADTWPVARLRFPTRGVELPVLHGDGGNSLAFAPGRALASAPLGTEGISVIGGHRDTHFAVLQHVARGEIIELQLASGRWRGYAVSDIRIADSTREFMPLSHSGEELLLVTCYPFDALHAGGPLRYVVTATPVTRKVRASTLSI